MSPLCKLGQLTDPSAWAGDVNMLYREKNDPDNKKGDVPDYRQEDVPHYREKDDPDYKKENVPDYRVEDVPDYKEKDVPHYIPDKKYSQRERYPTKEMEEDEILMRVYEVR